MTERYDAKLMLGIGANERWWCPSCGNVFRKANYVHRSFSKVERFHSNKCRAALQRKLIIVARESL